MTSPRTPDTDVIVVGGGLAGLTAAATAARSGARVVLVEARSEAGGRARSEHVDGYTFNQGAHALYRANAGMAILRGLGIRPQGHVPLQKGGAWLRAGERIPFRRLSAAGGGDALRAVWALMSGKAAAGAEGQSIGAWLDRHIPDDARPFADFLVRITSYTADQEHTEASAMLTQVKAGAKGVLYLDGGWSSLVDSLRAVATQAGVQIRPGKVDRVTATGDAVTVAMADEAVTGRSVVIANGGPGHVDTVLGGASAQVGRWAAEARPVLASCLDVALARSPEARRQTSFALDEPLYLVDHAATAALAPRGGALYHGLYYEPDLRPGVDARERLEAALDLVQPGWRDEVVALRPSRSLVVAHDRPRVGVAREDMPRVEVDDVAGVFVAGDWLTRHGLLADAAIGSGAHAGVQAARLALPAAAAPGAAAAANAARAAVAPSVVA